MKKYLITVVFFIAALMFFFQSPANSKELYEKEYHFKQSPVFYLTIFPKDVKSQEAYYFNRALEYFTMREFELSREKIQQLQKIYPQTEYNELAEFLKADIEFFIAVDNKKTDLTINIHLYQDVISTYPDSKYAPWALFQTANCYNLMDYSYEAIASYDRFLEKYPDSPHYEYAAVYDAEMNYNASKLKRVIDILNAFQARFAESRFLPIVNFMTGDSYYRLGDKKKGYEFLDKAKGIEKGDPQKAMYYAKILIEAKEYKKAIYNLTSVINYFPKYKGIEDTYEMLADCFLELSDYNNAVYNYFYIIKTYPKSRQAVKSRLMIAQIGSFIDEKKYSIVMKSSDVEFVLDLKNVYTEVYLNNKDNKYGQKALFELAMMAEKQGNDLRGMKIFKKIYDDYPADEFYEKSFKKFIELFNRIIIRYYSNNETTRIVELYQKYKKEIDLYKGSDISEALYNVGKALTELKLYSKASEVFQKVKWEEKGFKAEEVLYYCTLTSYMSKEFSQSEAFSGEFALNFSKSAYLNDIEYYKAKSVFNLGRYDEAVNLLKGYMTKRIEEISIDKKIEIDSDIADAYDALGKESNAIAYLKDCLVLVRNAKDSDYASHEKKIVLRIAGLSYISGNKKEAIKYYHEYLKDKLAENKLVPEDNSHLFYLARSYQLTDDYDSAKLYFNTLLQNSDRDFYAKSAKEEIKNIEFKIKYEDYDF